MSPRLRFAIFALISACIALVAGVGIAQEEYAFAGLLCGISLWVAIEWRRRAHPEAWFVAALLAGYLIGNRGFAQFSLLANFPLLPAEAGLLIGVPALLIRMAFKQTSMVRRDALNYVIIFWILLAAARLPMDFRQSGILAVRDFAMVYYAVFFFMAQAFCGHEPSRKLLVQTLTWAFVALPVVVLSYQLAPEFFLTQLVWRGSPLLFHKSDLSAAFLGGGFFWLWTRWEQHRRALWLLPACMSLALIATMASPRAAMVSLAIVSLCWLASGRSRVLLAQLGLIAAGTTILLFTATVTNHNIRETPLYSVYEHALSIFDVHGQRDYLHARSGDPVDNNRFRLVWWESVIDETMETNPTFGLGFGHDLAARFLANYEKVGAEDFSARSPHSMIVTMFGRMGITGVSLWIVVAGFIARLAWRSFRGDDLNQLGLMSVAIVIWVSACFGVVLEGPMGAVVFWTLLGLANAQSVETEAAPDEATTVSPVSELALPAADANVRETAAT